MHINTTNKIYIKICTKFFKIFDSCVDCHGGLLWLHSNSKKKEEEEEERAETVVDISREATREERVWLQAFQMAPILSPLGRSKTKTIASTKNRLSQFIDASTVWACSIILGIQWDWSSTVQGVVQMASQNLTTLGVPSFRPFYLFFCEKGMYHIKENKSTVHPFFYKKVPWGIGKLQQDPNCSSSPVPAATSSSVPAAIVAHPSSYLHSAWTSLQPLPSRSKNGHQALESCKKFLSPLNTFGLKVVA